MWLSDVTFACPLREPSPRIASSHIFRVNHPEPFGIALCFYHLSGIGNEAHCCLNLFLARTGLRCTILLSMAIVPVFKSGEEGTELQTWRNEPEPEGLSLWDSFFGRGSLFDPFLFRRLMDDPLDAFPLWDYTPSSLFAKDAQAIVNTHVDWWESSDAHIIQADFPGATKDDVEIIVENGRVLQISGRSKMAAPPSGGRCRRGERSRVGYLRRLRLPSNAHAEQLKAEMENGVLTVTIPKKAVEQPELRIVEIQE